MHRVPKFKIRDATKSEDWINIASLFQLMLSSHKGIFTCYFTKSKVYSIIISLPLQ